MLEQHLLLYIKHIDLTRLGTDSGAADFYAPRMPPTPRHRTSIGRLPLKHGPDRRETLPKRVSDDSRQLNFRRQKMYIDDLFS